MRACIQRVSRARVTVGGDVTGAIDRGLVVLLGVGEGDHESDAHYMAGKVVQLRIFADDQGKMNRSIAEVGGKVLAVSQFTLFGDTRKGRRPSFVTAANPEAGKALYEKFIRDVRAMKVPVEAGIFQADMQVELVNDGPVTILIDSRKQF